MDLDEQPDLDFIGYSAENLISAIETGLPSYALTSPKKQYDYLISYLSYFKPKTIIKEREYLDLGFLDDYSMYYSQSFREYRQKCSRLHFFSDKIDEEVLNNQILNQAQLLKLHGREKLPAKNTRALRYLGYLIVKPLAQAYLGRTCLRVYNAGKQQSTEIRHYEVTKLYTVHLCGMRLAIRTLGFQEQDRIVSRCATNALWSALQATGSLFQHHIPSLFEIANTEDLPLDGATRILPSSGLSVKQMAQVFRSYGLHPEVFIPFTCQQLMNYCYAHLRCGIPVIAELGSRAIRRDNSMRLTVDQSMVAGENALDPETHAVCVTGYSVEDVACESDYKSSEEGSEPMFPFRLRGQAVKRLYAHDDQRGPFTRYLAFKSLRNLTEFTDDTRVKPTIEKWRKSALVRDSVKDEVQTGNSVMLPHKLLVPLHRLIRINYTQILSTVSRFNLAWSYCLNPARIWWDVYLYDSLRLKEELMMDVGLSGNQRLKISTKNMPKYIWIAKLYKDKSVLADFIFDATDSHLADYLFLTVVRDHDSFELGALGIPEFLDDDDVHLTVNYAQMIMSSIADPKLY